MISRLSLLLIFSFLFFSCNKDDDTLIDPAATVDGEWQVSTVKTTLQNKGTEAATTNLDLSSDGIYFNFQTDGTYSTNAKISLSSVTKSENIITGTYKFGSNNIELDYYLEDFSVNVDFNFTINELTNNNFVISLDEKSLTDAFNGSIGSLSAANQVFAKLLIDNIVDFEILINLKK